MFEFGSPVNRHNLEKAEDEARKGITVSVPGYYKPGDN